MARNCTDGKNCFASVLCRVFHTFDLSYLQVGCGGSYLHPPQDDILLLGGYGGCILLRTKSVPELILMNYVHTLNENASIVSNSNSGLKPQSVHAL